ncbi:MAG: sugar-binding protein, partial [Chitinophagaceae bacterium]
MKSPAVYFLFAMAFFIIPYCYGYRIITPLPFSVANKNYIKLQILADKGDVPADSIFCDILYNAGAVITKRLNASLAVVLTLNEFNDGVFNVKARIYHGMRCDTLGSKYSTSGIPVLLDRHQSFNEAVFRSVYIDRAEEMDAVLRKATPYQFAGNNNTVLFSSCWNEDSLYFRFDIKDAQLNAAPSRYWDLFQAKNFLQVLWTSDCIELGFDLKHDRTEWKETDDYEFLANINGKTAGNQWNIRDSIYRHWGKTARVNVRINGTVNNNEDMDSGYIITMAIPWQEMKFQPAANQSIGFDIQLYDKDGDNDEPFRSSLSGTNPESNDNTSEWVSLVLEKKNTSYTGYLYWLILPIILLLAWLIMKRKKKR